MDLASEEGIEPNMTAVEVCDCPPGYGGLSCEVRESKLCLRVKILMFIKVTIKV